MNATATIRLTDVREQAALALAPEAPEDPEVFTEIVDAVTPPALLLLWADPWLDKNSAGGRTMGGTGYWDAWLEVLAIASRVEPGPGMTRLEELTAFVIARLQADTYTWPPETFYAPRRFDIGGITYLGARMIFKVPVTI